MQSSAGSIPGSTLWSRAAVIMAAMIFGLTYSLSAALIALDLAERGSSDAFIGVNAAMHAVGVLAMAFVLPRFAARIGMRRMVIGALAVAVVLLVLFPAVPSIWLWFPIRIVLGAASETLFVMSETWLNSLSTDATRARAMAAYTAALSVGFALGPFTLSLVGTQGGTAYWIGAGFSILALMCLAMPGIAQPVFDGPADANPLRFIMLAPLAMAATVLHATVESAGLSFLALYAVKLGWLETEATQLMSCMMVGAIILQLPIGWLGDKLDRRRMIIVLAGLAVIGALVWPWALLSPWTTYPLLFVWGGVFVGIYTIMLTIVGSRFSGSQLVGIYAAMGLMWGAGALIGPVFAGVAMQGLTHGLPLFVALACTCFMCAAICSPARDVRALA
ncbi:MFS family permease [Tardiphaga robiniae]|jgi:MFS family permease|uniref:MFS transporter n=1 Tax=Tardiphaga robiniae TaxID=943830 RepID=UPI002855F100|nr:MFS transporter [Tardiphaga robiniae]MDR6660644.1 MFS family permease [Tardiphaga robiniae]